MRHHDLRIARGFEDRPDRHADSHLVFGVQHDSFDPDRHPFDIRTAVEIDKSYYVRHRGRERRQDRLHHDRVTVYDACAARRWCEDATALASTQWRYPEVPQKHFEQLQPATLTDLMTTAEPDVEN